MLVVASKQRGFEDRKLGGVFHATRCSLACDDTVERQHTQRHAFDVALDGLGIFDRERVEAETVTLRATQQTYIQYYRVRHADGTDVRVRVRVRPVPQRGDGAGYVHVVTVCPPAVRFGQPLIASIVRPTPLVVDTATIAEDEGSFARIAVAAVE